MGRRCLSLSEQDQSLERSGEEIFTVFDEKMFITTHVTTYLPVLTLGI